ncbi:MAG: hypothetical protein WCA20_08360 [Candidatus Sulfotelmatobacter sp.]
MLGRWDEAIATGEKLTLLRREGLYVGQLGLAYALSGQREKAAELRQELLLRQVRNYGGVFGESSGSCSEGFGGELGQ